MNDSIVTRKRIELNQAMVSKRLRLRLSRTGGLSAGWHPFRGVTFNTQYGFRVSNTRKGLTLGVQSGRLVFRGRWNLGKYFRLNLSRTKGFSLSWKNELGALNLTRPQYSSAKLFGVQVRGKRAHSLQMHYLLFRLIIWAFHASVIVTIWTILITIRIQQTLAMAAFFSGQAFHLIVDWFVYLGRVAGITISALIELAWLELIVLMLAIWQFLTAGIAKMFTTSSNKGVPRAKRGTRRLKRASQRPRATGPTTVSDAKSTSTNKSSINVTSAMSVSQLQMAFKERLKLNVRVYQGRRIAKSNTTLSALSNNTFQEATFKVSGRSKVKAVEDSFKNVFVFRIQILDMDGNLAENNLSIAKSRTR